MEGEDRFRSSVFLVKIALRFLNKSPRKYSQLSQQKRKTSIQ